MNEQTENANNEPASPTYPMRPAVALAMLDLAERYWKADRRDARQRDKRVASGGLS